MVELSGRLSRAPRLRDALFLFVLCLLSASLFCSGNKSEAAASGVRALVLGIAQDGAFPTSAAGKSCASKPGETQSAVSEWPRWA